MSYVIRKERCPQCAKIYKDRRGDNLAVYSDGHQYCFSCGYYVQGSVKERILSKKNREPGSPLGLLQSEKPSQKSKYDQDDLYLPEDVVPCTYGPGYTWLKQYDLTTFDILEHKILWSEYRQWLIFPYYEDHHLLGFQARNFNKDKPYKYYTQGNVKDILWTFGPQSNTIVIVEDIVSAIKVSKVQQSLALLGSIINVKLLLRIKLLSSNLIIWLDPDKQKEMIKFSQISQSLGIQTTTIFTDKDPKEYSYSEIKDILCLK